MIPHVGTYIVHYDYKEAEREREREREREVEIQYQCSRKNIKRKSQVEGK